MITGKSVCRRQLAAAMVAALFSMSESLLTEKTTIMAQYRTDCVTIGKEVSVHRFEEVRHGTAVGVDEDGALLVRFPDGHTENIGSGEVSIRGMYGYV
jgi:BirA family biotin operon repressor/biotin-[acetyl-CoA-carboxylase] ligase